MYKVRSLLLIILLVSPLLLINPIIIKPIYAADTINGGTYQLKEHRFTALPAINDPDVTFTNTTTYIESDNGAAATPIAYMYNMIVFNASDLQGFNIEVWFTNDWTLPQGEVFDIRILDSSYLRSNATQFPDKGALLLQGGGVLQTIYTTAITHGTVTNSSRVTMDTSGATYDGFVTLMMRMQDTHDNTRAIMQIFNVTIRATDGTILYEAPIPANLIMETAGTDNDYGYLGPDVGDPTGTNFNKASIDGVSISNLEACGNWVYAEEQYYNYVLLVGGGNISDTILLQIADGVTNVTLRWDSITRIASHVSGSNITTMGTVTSTLNTAINQLTVTFPILFKKEVLDALNVDIKARANDTNGVDTGWITIATDAFSIYNLGGLVQTVASGTAGRVAGGDTFELQAANKTSAFANQTFRKIQQFRAQFGLRLSDEAAGTGFVIGFQDLAHNGGSELYMDKGDWQVEMAMNYCDPSAKVMVKGFYVIFMMEDGDLGTNDLWTRINATWYDRDDTKIKSDLFTAWPETQIATTRFWVDMWFNKINASSVGGGRLNAYYTGMDTTAFLLWQGGWSPMITNSTDSLAFIPLLDNASNSITSPQLDLMSVSVNISRPANSAGTDGRNITATLVGWTQLDMKFALGQMKGIDTPVPVETKVPDMPVSGFFAPLIAAVLGIGTFVAEGIGSLATMAWDALDSQFPFVTTGIESIYKLTISFGAFLGVISNNLSSLLDYFAGNLSFFTTLVDAAGSSFGFITVWLAPFATNLDGWITLFLIIFVVIPFTVKTANGDLGGMESDLRKAGGIIQTGLDWSLRLLNTVVNFITGLLPF